MISPETGLFIAVDSYPYCGSENALNAAAGAYRFASYFQGLQPDKIWTVASESADFLPNRCDVIDLITKWSPTVRPNTSGLLYFAGHGALVNGKGFVLAGRDWRPSLPYDSGIPLRRLFHIISETGDPDACFLVILDACRCGDPHIGDDIPPANIVVVFSCAVGERALENDVSSSYVDSFLRSIPRCLTKRKGKFRYCSLNSLITEQVLEIRDLSGGLTSEIECHGTKQALIWIPVQEQKIAFQQVFLRTELKTRPIAARLSSSVIRRLNHCFAQIVPGHHGTGRSVQRFYSEERNEVTIKVLLPQPSVLCSPQSALNFVLSACPAMFESLTLVWPNAVDEHWIHRAGRLGRFEYTALTRKHFMLTWSDGEYEGQGYVVVSDKQRTRIEITCQPKGQRYKFFLEYLESLGNMYDSLIVSIARH